MDLVNQVYLLLSSWFDFVLPLKCQGVGVGKHARLVYYGVDVQTGCSRPEGAVGCGGEPEGGVVGWGDTGGCKGETCGFVEERPCLLVEEIGEVLWKERLRGLWGRQEGFAGGCRGRQQGIFHLGGESR